jgi:hypothetical protein
MSFNNKNISILFFAFVSLSDISNFRLSSAKFLHPKGQWRLNILHYALNEFLVIQSPLQIIELALSCYH